jgi:hypothetical protein
MQMTMETKREFANLCDQLKAIIATQITTINGYIVNNANRD